MRKGCFKNYPLARKIKITVFRTLVRDVVVQPVYSSFPTLNSWSKLMICTSC